MTTSGTRKWHRVIDIYIDLNKKIFNAVLTGDLAPLCSSISAGTMMLCDIDGDSLYGTSSNNSKQCLFSCMEANIIFTFQMKFRMFTGLKSHFPELWNVVSYMGQKATFVPHVFAVSWLTSLTSRFDCSHGCYKRFVVCWQYSILCLATASKVTSIC